MPISEIGIVRKIKPDLGLVRDDAHLDAPEWSKAIRDLLATEKPSAIVVMLGLNDRLPLRDRIPATKENTTLPDNAHPPATAAETQRQRPGENHEFHTDKWTELYSKRIDDMIAAIKTKGVPIVWVGLPAIRGAKSTSDMSYLDELFRTRADKAGITYIDIWDGFVDDQGRYAVQGPDFEGQIRRLRGGDGVHFTTAGALKLAHYAEHDLRRLLSKRVVPVALPGSDAGGGTATAIGPVVPLDANAGEGDELLGAGRGPAPAMSDPIATRVMSRGAAIATPVGRADDFSWPRAEAKEPAPTQVEVVPPAPSPAAPPATSAKDAAGKNAVKKPSDAKKESVPNAAPAGLRRSRAGLDGASRPPLPVGTNAR
jgi:lysophospholipase L1-like esterase